MWLFYEDKYWNYILDKSIVFSFDKTGYQRYKSKFNVDISKKSLTDKISLVTGGTSGIGGEVSKEHSRIGSMGYVTGRNKQNGNYFEKNNLNLSFNALDMANWKALDNFCKK